MNIPETDKQFIWHPFTQMQNAPLPVYITKAEGTCFFDNEGNRYIDAISSWWVNLHGHAHPYIAQKVSEQLHTLEHVIFDGFTHAPAVQLAQKLMSHLPANIKKIFFSDNGSTSVEVALKMALQYWHNQGIAKTKIIAFKNSYHGDTFGSMSVSSRNVFTNAFTNLLFEVIFIDAPTEGNEIKSVNQLKHVVQANDIAAFIFEPLVQGACGMLMHQPEALDNLLLICKQHNIITIADEVMTGFGRTGKFFASDHLQHKPDIMCLSKGLTGGTMPLGITAAAQFIFDAFLSADKTKTFFHGHSFTANPVACSAALASMELMEREITFDNINRIAQHHTHFLQKLKQHPKVENARQTGVILAFNIKSDVQSDWLNPVREKIYPFFLQKGIILRPLGNVIYILPPYCITNEELSFIYEAIEEFLETI